ncbi:hypothetical protein TKK_0011316 [Trichogramma kaykai]
MQLFCDTLSVEVWRNCKRHLCCLKCAKRFSDWRCLRKHMNFFCQIDPLYQCPYCIYRARNRRAAMVKKEILKGSSDLFLISSSKLLNTSATSSTPGTPASQSPASASGAAEPQQHHKCKHCGATYQVRSMLERHLARTCKRVPRSEIYQCNFCAYQSTYKANIERHVRNLHDTMQADYKCELCDFKSKYLYCVRRHMKTFHPQ